MPPSIDEILDAQFAKLDRIGGASIDERIFGRRRRGRKPPTLPELQQQAAQLEAQVAETGARTPEQDRPGVFRTLLDLLSRPNYAIAGFVEEILGEQPSVTRGVKRALTEIFSGVGGVQGEKRAFGETLERLGVGTVTLADAFPALEGTWVGNFGSRGAAGLALDIFTDPLTYMTAGAGIGAKFAGKAGTVALKPAGVAKWAEIQRKHFRAVAGLDRPLAATGAKDAAAAARAVGKDVADRVLGNEGSFRKALDAATAEMDEVLGRTPDLIDPGGLKLFGKTIPGTPGKLKVLRSTVRSAIESLPAGDRIIESTRQLADGITGSMRSLFHPHNKVAGLGAADAPAAIRMHRDAINGGAVHRGRLASIARSVEKEFNKIVKARYKGDPEALGRKFYEVREGDIPITALADDEREIYDAVAGIFDSMFDTALDVGALDESQRVIRYFHHGYKNDPGDWSEVLAAVDGFVPRSSLPKHTRSREFATYREAVEVSNELNRVTKASKAAGKNVPEYPILEPDYNIFRNLARYIEDHSNMIARKAWVEEATQRFGKEIEELDLDVLYELARTTDIDGKDLAILEKFYGDTKSLRALDQGLQESLEEVSEQSLGFRPKALDAFAREADRVLPRLSERGKREFFKEAFKRVRSPAQFADLVIQMDRRWGKFFPEARAIKAGEVAEGAEHLGAYVSRAGKFWGPKPILIPKAIADDIENVNSKILELRDHTALKKLFGGFDWSNNWFKTGVYTFWPASLTRDAYSNIALSFLDIGVGAANPAAYRHAIGIMGNGTGTLEIAGGRFDYKTLRKLAEDFNVIVPGEAFVELTGAGADNFGATVLQRGAKFMIRKRALVENSARVQLWVQNMRRGMDPRTAADKVAEFLFNYGEVSAVEREFFRRLIPFYCVPEENEALTRQGWKRWGDIAVGDPILTMSSRGYLEWQPCLEVAAFDAVETPMLSFGNSRRQFTFTPDHRWVTTRGVKRGTQLRFSNETIVCGGFYDCDDSSLTPEQAELLGWIITDGYYRFRGNHCEAMIYQSPHKFLKTVRRVCGATTPRAPHPDTGVICVPVQKELVEPLKDILRSRDFAGAAAGLSAEAAESMYDAMYLADGNTKEGAQEFFACQKPAVASAFQVLAILTGRRVTQGHRGFYISYSDTFNSRSLSLSHYSGKVWCPRTENGTWVMRQGGVTTVTGNTFTRKNVELQAKALVRTPGRVVNQLKPFRGRTDENESMVQWEAEALKMRLDRDGKTVHMLTGIDLPLRNLDVLWRGGVRKTGRGLMGMVTPIIKTIPEVLLDRDFFQGRDLKRTESGSVGRVIEALGTPQGVKDWLGYRKRVDDAGRPRYTFDGTRFQLLFRSWMFSRAISTSDRQFRDNMDDGGFQWQRAVFDMLTGIRRKDINMDEQMRRRLNERIRQLQDSLVRRGEMLEFTKPFAPRER